MRDNVGDFLDAIVESKFDRLEALVLHNYKQFMHLYWMLRSYATDIKSLKYAESGKQILTVTVDITNSDTRDTILCEVESDSNADSHIEEKNKLVIQMMK